MNNITEIIPDDFPAWAQEAMDNGQLFTVMCEKAKQLEQANQRIAELESPWISVEDRLPISGRMIWVSGGCAQYSHPDEAWYSFMERDYSGNLARIQWEVKHWQDLPAPK